MHARESQRRLRIFVELRARFILLDGSLTGPAFVSAMSQSDLFVETDHPLPIGALVRLRLYIPGDRAFDVRGMVRRHGDGKHMLGMRIEFVELEADAHAAISRYLQPSIHTILEPHVNGTPVEDIPLSQRFDPDALQLFATMHGKMLQFFETLDTETARALLGEPSKTLANAEPEPAKVPAPFESVKPGLLDPELLDAESLPLVSGVVGDPDESVDEAERIRQKYAFDDSLFDLDGFKSKYAIRDDLFGDDPEPPARSPIPPWPNASQTPAASGAFKSSPPPPRADQVVSKINETAEQRRACAVELRKRGEDALARGLVLKAASELGLAIAFDPNDASLRALYERVRAQASSVRAEESYQQALQQSALGDGAAASRLLLGATQLSEDRKYLVAAARSLYQLRTPDSLKEARTLLRGALERLPNDADLHFLFGKTAEAEGVSKLAVRSYARVLELVPDHPGARESLARLEETP